MKISTAPIGLYPAPKNTDHDIHIVPNAGLWCVKNEALPYYSGSFLTQLEAIAEGRQQAREGVSLLFIHNRSGQVRAVEDHRRPSGFPD